MPATTGLLDQSLRPSAQGTRHADILVGDEAPQTAIVEAVTVDDDACLALGQRAAAVGALRDRGWKTMLAAVRRQLSQVPRW